jgi:hypothetical protein
MDRNLKYYKFSAVPNGAMTTPDGRLVAGIGFSLEDIPQNSDKLGRGNQHQPEWLRRMRDCLARDSDDARASLKEFDFRLNTSAHPDNVDNLILPSTSANPGISRNKRGKRNEELIETAINRGITRVIAEGGSGRRHLHSGIKKADINRHIRMTIRQDIAALAPEMRDYEIARVWYCRLRALAKMYRRGVGLYAIGKKWGKLGSNLMADQERKMIDEASKVMLPENDIELESMLISSYQSGTNPSDLWFGLSSLFDPLEVLAIMGRAKLGIREENDSNKAIFLWAYLVNGIYQMPERKDNIDFQNELLRYARFLIFSAPAHIDAYKRAKLDSDSLPPTPFELPDFTKIKLTPASLFPPGEPGNEVLNLTGIGPTDIILVLDAAE